VPDAQAKAAAGETVHEIGDAGLREALEELGQNIFAKTGSANRQN